MEIKVNDNTYHLEAAVYHTLPVDVLPGRDAALGRHLWRLMPDHEKRDILDPREGVTTRCPRRSKWSQARGGAEERNHIQEEETPPTPSKKEDLFPSSNPHLKEEQAQWV